MTSQNRVAAGVPTGGQFAATAHAESTTALAPAYEPPPAPVNHAAPEDYYPDVHGSKYTGFRDAAAIAKDVRADIKAAVDAGHLPASVGGHDVAYSVRCRKYAGGQAIDVTITGMADRDIYDAERGPWGERRKSQAAKDLVGKVERIAKAYNRSRSEGMVDYFDETYWCNVTIEDESAMEWRIQEKTMDAFKRQLRDARRAGADTGEIEKIRSAARDAAAAHAQARRERNAAEEMARAEAMAEAQR